MTEVKQGGPDRLGVISTPVPVPPKFSDHGLFRQFGTEQAKRFAGHMSCELELVVKKRTETGFAYCADAHLLIDQIVKEYPALKRYVDVEFFGGQVEFRTDPHLSRTMMINQLIATVGLASGVAEKMGYALVAEEYIPDNVVLPAEWVSPVRPRYAEYAATHRDSRDAMFRVSSLQFRIGCATLEQAIAVHNIWSAGLLELIADGWADSRRLAVFEGKIFPPLRGKPLFPPQVKDKHELVKLYERAGTVDSPKTHYPHVRIDAAVTEGVEHRLGGATLDPAVMLARAKLLYQAVNHSCFPDRVKKGDIASHYPGPDKDPDAAFRIDPMKAGYKHEEGERPVRVEGHPLTYGLTSPRSNL